MMDKCPFCSGRIEASQTTFTVELGFGVVVVRDVPAQVCSQCGSDWIEDDVAQTLEGIVNEAKSKHAMVEITRYDEIKRAS